MSDLSQCIKDKNSIGKPIRKKNEGLTQTSHSVETTMALSGHRSSSAAESHCSYFHKTVVYVKDAWLRYASWSHAAHRDLGMESHRGVCGYWVDMCTDSILSQGYM